MGMVINRTPIDARLLNDAAFYDFFVDYYTAEAEARMRTMIEEEHTVIMDDQFSCRAAMSDEAYVTEVYKEYKNRNA